MNNKYLSDSYMVLPAEQVRTLSAQSIKTVLDYRVNWLNTNYKIFADYQNNKKKKWWQWKEPRRFDASLSIKEYIPQRELPDDMLHFLWVNDIFNRYDYLDSKLLRLIPDSSSSYTEKHDKQLEIARNLLLMSDKIFTDTTLTDKNMYISGRDYYWIS